MWNLEYFILVVSGRYLSYELWTLDTGRIEEFTVRKYRFVDVKVVVCEHIFVAKPENNLCRSMVRTLM